MKPNIALGESNKMDVSAANFPLTKRFDATAQAELRQMLACCQNYHEECRTQRNAFSPKRLIHIEKIDGGFRLKLRSQTDLDAAEPYVALSYCWGGDQLDKTTRSRVQEYSREIPWKSIGATIKDAVEVVSRLGLVHLWVDAFCIVQDDRDDLLEQLPQMPRIYSQAVVTVVASRAKACTEGFLQYPELEDMTRFVAPIKIKLSAFPNDQEATAFSLNQDVWCPTEKRGWCFQEKWLSTRLVEFQTTAVRWSCISMERFIGLPMFGGGWGTSYEFRYRKHFVANIPEDVSQLTEVSETNSSNSDPLYMWRIAVQQYSDRGLSKPEDRAMAISGIAQLFNQKLQTAYYAGLWGKLFPEHLLWQRGWKTEVSPRVQTYQGPSWSWLSGIQRVQFAEFFDEFVGYDFECQIDVLDVRVTLESELNPYGRVKGGCITVKGRLRRARMIHPNASEQIAREYDVVRFEPWNAQDKPFSLLPTDAFGEYDQNDYILVDPEYLFTGSGADVRGNYGETRISGESAIDDEGEVTISGSKSLRVVSPEEESILDDDGTPSLDSEESSNLLHWMVSLGTERANTSKSCTPFSEAYDLNRFGTLISGRMQPDALEKEFLLSSSSESQYVEVQLLEFGRCVEHERSDRNAQSGTLGLVLREVTPTGQGTHSRREFSRLGTFRLEETYAVLRPPDLSTQQWREIACTQLDGWFSDCEEEIIDIV